MVGLPRQALKCFLVQDLYQSYHLQGNKYIDIHWTLTEPARARRSIRLADKHTPPLSKATYLKAHYRTEVLHWFQNHGEAVRKGGSQ